MPELLEVERYREQAEAVLGRRIDGVRAPDAWYLKRGLTADVVEQVLVGARLVGTGRRGKLLLLQTDRDVTLGLRFGMTGILVVDGEAAIERLEYSSARAESAWDRFALHLEGGELRMRDPRRLGGVELDPDLDQLGPDATTVTRRELADLLDSAVALKARLMDQGRLAGMGNLLTDECLWRAGFDPARPARSLDVADVTQLHRSLRQTLRVLGRRGGSHCGDLQAARTPGATCPRDGTALQRRTIGGRTTYSCPLHQR
jgi:formamidopyrimidine-DNA glycosylase